MGGGPRWSEVGGDILVCVGSKHQVRHNIGVWALDTVRLCVSMEGGTALGTGGGGALILFSFTFM